MSNNKFEALVSDDSDSEDLVNSQQLEVIAYSTTCLLALFSY